MLISLEAPGCEGGGGVVRPAGVLASTVCSVRASEAKGSGKGS